MSNFFIAFLCGLSAGVWTYNKFMKTTGNNTKNAAIGGSMVGVLAFLVLLVVMSFIN